MAFETCISRKITRNHGGCFSYMTFASNVVILGLHLDKCSDSELTFTYDFFSKSRQITRNHAALISLIGPGLAHGAGIEHVHVVIFIPYLHIYIVVYGKMLNIWPSYIHYRSFGGKCRYIYHTLSIWMGKICTLSIWSLHIQNKMAFESLRQTLKSNHTPKPVPCTRCSGHKMAQNCPHMPLLSGSPVAHLIRRVSNQTEVPQPLRCLVVEQTFHGPYIGIMIVCFKILLTIYIYNIIYI